MRFVDQVAVVTGAGSGIGRLTAECLAAEGAAVEVLDVNAAAAGEVADTIRAAGGEARAVSVDVRDYHAVRQAMARTLESRGRIDVLVNAAGATRRGSSACRRPSRTSISRSSTGGSMSTSRGRSTWPMRSSAR